MKTDDSLPVLTYIDFDFPTLTPTTLGQPIGPRVTFFLRPSTTASDAQSDSVFNNTGIAYIYSLHYSYCH